MGKDYKVTAVEEEVKSWQSSYGPMVTYTLLLDDTGEEFIQQNKKPDSPVPKVGDILYGNIERNAFGAKFKTEARPTVAVSGLGTKSEYKDHSKDITLGMVWKTIAGIRGLPENKTQFEQFFLIVREHLDELLLMSDQMSRGTADSPSKESGDLSSPNSAPEPEIKRKLAKGFGKAVPANNSHESDEDLKSLEESLNEDTEEV